MKWINNIIKIILILSILFSCIIVITSGTFNAEECRKGCAKDYSECRSHKFMRCTESKNGCLKRSTFRADLIPK
ncbi:hypothetical protein PPL_00164 [Heterostelium album PN500]|uniref:Uncharacterized protein n=1 Tax=Heterostelium pallidum (strain ATCC 26659 / Pp 5 / PN500) TaxID=670386 RepID=D3AVP9_HETP5|nr:hypothetical protein PPL_00164 [Heterostelium album PN500]EFA86372.1 hypothetical protein PPL_00164 [Heterostelium album PN500]|eukprot:XP_020438477.1 hypothetical protein PPL_00164 [Heterostelium album PN500]